MIWCCWIFLSQGGVGLMFVWRRTVQVGLGLGVVFLLAGLLLSAPMGVAADDAEEGDPIVEKEKLSGYVQKGPFNSGTNITISELNKDLSQTGRTYTTQTTTNSGNFELSKLELVSGFVSFRSDGFYFNEVCSAFSSNVYVSYAYFKQLICSFS